MGFIFFSLVELAVVGHVDKLANREKRQHDRKVDEEERMERRKSHIDMLHLIRLDSLATQTISSPTDARLAWIQNATLGLKRRSISANSETTPAFHHRMSMKKVSRFRENVHKQSVVRWQKLEWTGDKVDRLCQIAFPAVFLVFNIAYWLYYTHQSVKQMQRLLNLDNLSGSVTSDS